MGNLTNIFPSQIDKLLILDVDVDKEKRVVTAIDTTLKRIADAKKNQENMRQEICDSVLTSLS